MHTFKQYTEQSQLNEEQARKKQPETHEYHPKVSAEFVERVINPHGLPLGPSTANYMRWFHDNRAAFFHPGSGFSVQTAQNLFKTSGPTTDPSKQTKGQKMYFREETVSLLEFDPNRGAPGRAKTLVPHYPTDAELETARTSRTVSPQLAGTKKQKGVRVPPTRLAGYKFPKFKWTAPDRREVGQYFATKSLPYYRLQADIDAQEGQLRLARGVEDRRGFRPLRKSGSTVLGPIGGQLDEGSCSFVKFLSEKRSPAWQRKEGKDPEGGLNKKGVAAYRRENPGSKLQTAVTEHPSKLKKGSKKAKRRKSFCSRMKGMKRKLTSAKTARDPNSRINKSLRKWNCE